MFSLFRDWLGPVAVLCAVHSESVCFVIASF